MNLRQYMIDKKYGQTFVGLLQDLLQIQELVSILLSQNVKEGFNVHLSAYVCSWDELLMIRPESKSVSNPGLEDRDSANSCCVARDEC